MHVQKRAVVVVDGAVFEAVVTVSPVPTRGWFTLPTVVTRDGQPVRGVLWMGHGADASRGFLFSLERAAAEQWAFARLSEGLHAARPRARVMAEVRIGA